MRRRTFIVLTSSAAAWPVAAVAQSAPVIGFMTLAARDTIERFLLALYKGLAEAGFEESRNLVIEFRFADGDQGRLAAMAADLVRRKVAAIVSGGGPAPALAAKAATATIPVVFTAVGDPREGGLVASLARPGGNVTGISVLSTELDPKRLELLCEAVPAAKIIGVLRNPQRPDARVQLDGVHRAAATLNRQLVI